MKGNKGGLRRGRGAIRAVGFFVAASLLWMGFVLTRTSPDASSGSTGLNQAVEHRAQAVVTDGESQQKNEPSKAAVVAKAKAKKTKPIWSEVEDDPR